MLLCEISLEEYFCDLVVFLVHFKQIQVKITINITNYLNGLTNYILSFKLIHLLV